MRARTQPNWKDVLPGDLVYLYVFSCQGHHKIGIARNPATRLTNLQVGNPFEITLSLYRTIRHESAAIVETAAHRALSEHHDFDVQFPCSRSRSSRLRG